MLSLINNKAPSQPSTCVYSPRTLSASSLLKLSNRLLPLRQRRTHKVLKLFKQAITFDVLLNCADKGQRECEHEEREKIFYCESSFALLSFAGTEIVERTDKTTQTPATIQTYSFTIYCMYLSCYE